MTRKTDPDLLKRICDIYCSGVTNSLSRIADMVGVSFASVYVWMKDPDLILDEYMGEQNISFGRAMQLARNVSKALTVSQSLEDFVLNGRPVQVWHHGEPSYVDDEAAVRASKEDFEFGLENGFFWPDRKKRDANGDRIIATRIEPPPAQILEVYARAALPQIYGHKIEQTIKDERSAGVTTIGARRPIPPEFVEFATKKDLQGEVTETLLLSIEEPEVYGTEPDAALGDLLGPTPEADMVVTDTPSDPVDVDAISPMSASRDAQQPEPVVIREPTPASYQPTPNPILGPGPRVIPAGWRTEWDQLQRRAALPDRTNRG